MKILKYSLPILLLFTPLIAWHASAQVWVGGYKAKLIKVIDGDTVKLQIEIYPSLFKEVNLRLQGIDAPESRKGIKNGNPISDCEIQWGKKATAHAKQILSRSKMLTVSDLDPTSTKYAGRIQGKLWFVPHASEYAPPMDFSLHMLNQKLATPYLGGSRASWPCNE